MSKHLYVGVDGGGTKTTLLVQDEDGHVIGKMTGPGANIRISVPLAWRVINSTLDNILTSAGFEFAQEERVLHIGMGLAGCEVEEAYLAFTQTPNRFKTLRVTSDAHIACLGAHAGHDGAIIIAGTGTVGYQIQSRKITRVGGWGFPQDDEGSGAWLGLQAIKYTLRSLDGRQRASDLTEAVYQFFNSDHSVLVSWANRANSAAYAELAPLVIEADKRGDALARQLLQEAAACINLIYTTLRHAQTPNTQVLPCTVLGGLANHLLPFLSDELKQQLRPAKEPPEVGAITFLKQALKQPSEVYA